MRKLIKILSGIVVIVVVVSTTIFYFNSGVEDADAYSILSEEFKSSTSLNDLKEYISKNSINNFKESSWESSSINGDRGILTGSVTTQPGSVIPLRLNFVKGEAGWKIYSLQKPSSGAQEEVVESQLPTENEQIELVSRSMNVFAISVNEQSMQKFYDHISALWKKQFSIKKFNEVYGSLFGVGADLRALNNHTPHLTSKAVINEGGILLLTGHYHTKPSGVLFQQKYIYEGFGWKLLGFSIDFK